MRAARRRRITAGELMPSSGTNTLLVQGNLAAGSTDYFQFTVPDKMDKETTILFRSQGVSLLAADLSITDDRGHIIASASSRMGWLFSSRVISDS